MLILNTTEPMTGDKIFWAIVAGIVLYCVLLHVANWLIKASGMDKEVLEDYDEGEDDEQKL